MMEDLYIRKKCFYDFIVDKINVLKFEPFLFLFANKMLVFRAGILKMHVRITNREDPDQTASSEAV